MPATAISDPNEVIGRGLILPVIQNEPILPMKLASKEAGAGLPPVITPGLRAVSVRVNEVIGVAGYVLPGTRVDVVATVSPTDQKQDMTSKVILTNVQVLAAGTKIERDTEKNKPMPVSVVTLLVDPDEAERLTLAEHRRQDSARAPKPAGQGHDADPRHPAGGAARHERVDPQGRPPQDAGEHHGPRRNVGRSHTADR